MILEDEQCGTFELEKQFDWFTNAVGWMGISELTVSPSGDYEVYYQDDDMFWGHIIIVSGNVETEIEDAYIAG